MTKLIKKGICILSALAVMAGVTIGINTSVKADACYEITASIPLVQLDRSANIIVTLKNNSGLPVSYTVYNLLTQEIFATAILQTDYVGHEFNLTSPRQENEILVVDMRDMTGALVASQIVYVNTPYAAVPTTKSYPEPLVPVMVPVYSAPYVAYPTPAMPKPVWTIR